MARPKDIGTAAETAVVKVFHSRGYFTVERRALRGTLDCGDLTGIPGLVVEVKGGDAAKTASDNQILEWLNEAERERRNANAVLGVLVVQRKGIGAQNAHRWWAVVDYAALRGCGGSIARPLPVRMHLGDFITLMPALL